MAETPKTFLLDDVEGLVGYKLPSLAKASRSDLAKLTEALRDRDRLADEVKMLREHANKLHNRLKVAQGTVNS